MAFDQYCIPLTVKQLSALWGSAAGKYTVSHLWCDQFLQCSYDHRYEGYYSTRVTLAHVTLLLSPEIKQPNGCHPLIRSSFSTLCDCVSQKKPHHHTSTRLHAAPAPEDDPISKWRNANSYLFSKHDSQRHGQKYSGRLIERDMRGERLTFAKRNGLWMSLV